MNRYLILLFLLSLFLACTEEDLPYYEPTDGKVHINSVNIGQNGSVSIMNSTGATRVLTGWYIDYEGPYCLWGCINPIPDSTALQNGQNRWISTNLLIPDTEAYNLYLYDENGKRVFTWYSY
ncbi:MAG: hypothetical protein AB1458_16420 [Bacteroidota bacterium]